MKKSNEELAKIIIDATNDKVINRKHSELVAYVENEISWQMDDVFKHLKNIKETSLNRDDEIARIYELESKFGIPKTHLL